MKVPFSYRRPAYVPATVGATLTDDEKQRFINDSLANNSSTRPGGIPDALSFERIIAGDVCPPCTVRDFMDYLKYIEHAPENLQFFLWYQDYLKRFSELPEREQELSPKWPMVAVPTKASPMTAGARTITVNNGMSAEVASIFKGTDFDDTIAVVATVSDPVNPFDTPPRTPATESESTGSSSFFRGGNQSSEWDLGDGAENHQTRAGHALKNVSKWQPFTIQPFREEITRIIAIYVADGSPRQLNLSSRERKAVLRGLTQTTHPSAFRGILTNVEWSLRCQAHPNFIRWTICNGNRPRVIFARGLGLFAIAVGLASGILITLSSAGRAWRVMALIGLMIGISTLIAAWKGMCVVLHGLHHRHLRPWELFSDEMLMEETKSSQSRPESLREKLSYEDEPWVAKYEKRNLVRKIFDREVWIEEPALRQIQDAIFYQSLLAALFLSALIVAIFCALPAGMMY